MNNKNKPLFKSCLFWLVVLAIILLIFWAWPTNPEPNIPPPTKTPTAVVITAEPTHTPTTPPSPTLAPTATATQTPTVTPTAEPTTTPIPTDIPTAVPSPTPSPTIVPLPFPEYYIVITGDNLWAIADLLYDDPFCWWGIWTENRHIIRDYNRIFAGQRFGLPLPCVRWQ